MIPRKGQIHDTSLRLTHDTSHLHDDMSISTLKVVTALHDPVVQWLLNYMTLTLLQHHTLQHHVRIITICSMLPAKTWGSGRVANSHHGLARHLFSYPVSLRVGHGVGPPHCCPRQIH